MIVVTIELHSAIDGRREKIGEMLIANDGTCEAAERGNYLVRVLRKGRWSGGWWDRGKVLRDGTVKDYPRLAYNVWRLVSRALLAASPEERGGRSK